MAVADKYEGEPIVFIAVNSGNDKVSVSKYLKKNKIGWPTIVDYDRAFEKMADVGEVSLRNIWQFATVNAEGEIRRSANDPEKAAQRVLKDAKWNVDLKLIPPALQAEWKAVEFGDYSKAARGLKRASNSSKPELKAGADVLMDYVSEKMNGLVTEADEARESDEVWIAYKKYSQAKEVFAGYDLPEEALEHWKELKSNKKVKSEISAEKQLASAGRIAAKSGVRRVIGKLKKLIEQHPDTEAAAVAQKVLDEN